MILRHIVDGNWHTWKVEQIKDVKVFELIDSGCISSGWMIGFDRCMWLTGDEEIEVICASILC